MQRTTLCGNCWKFAVVDFALELEDERKKRQLELEDKKDKLEKDRAARQQDQQQRQVLSEEFTSEHLLKKARFQNEVQKENTKS